MQKLLFSKNLNTPIKLLSSTSFKPSSLNFFVYKSVDQINEAVAGMGSSSELIKKKLEEKALSEVQLINEGSTYVFLKQDKESDKFINRRKSVKNITSKILSISSGLKEDDISVKYFGATEEELKWMEYFINYLNFQYNKKSEESLTENKLIKVYSDVCIAEENKNLIDLISKAKNRARTLVNSRADECTPYFFIDLGINFAKENNLRFKVFRDQELLDNNLNLVYSVGKGAENRPGMLAIEYFGNPDNSIPKEKMEVIALVGKGITFDTGGNNIKGTGFMETMFMDKGGACAVFEAFKAIVELKLKKNVIVVIPLAENSCDGKSYRPSDIIKSHKGLTVEILNTDAEGRLVLCDAMSWVQSNYNVGTLVELSTLTGASMIALGTKYVALFSNDEDLAENLQKSGGDYEEDLWRMPLNDEIKEELKGGVSDLVNMGTSRYGGAITAAEYLHYFVNDNVKWAHLDIAGKALDDSIKYQKGNKGLASGVGVATIVNYVKNSK